MTSAKIPLQVLLSPQIYQALQELAAKSSQAPDHLIEEAIAQYIADQSLDGSGWSSVFEKLVADNHTHLKQHTPNLKAAEIIAKKEELKRKKRLEKS